MANTGDVEMVKPADCGENHDDMETDEVEETNTDEQRLALAEDKKKQGNSQYSQKHYEEAVRLYSEAIELAPEVVQYYGNRAAAFMMLEEYSKALDDAQTAMRIDDTFVKGHYRAAKCHLIMGSTRNAVMQLQKVLERDPKNKEAQKDLRQAKMIQEYESSAFEAHDKQEYGKVLFCVDRIIDHCSACHLYRVMKAEALTLLGKYKEAMVEVHSILSKDTNNSDALYVRGLCLYYQDSVDKAYQHFNQVLRRDPDHKSARLALKKAKSLQNKKQQGNDLFAACKYQEAYDLYSEALSIDPRNKSTNAKLYYNRGMASAKLNKMEQAIEDCTQAINLDNTYIKAYLKRARCYMQQEQYEEGVRDFEKVYKMDKTRENRRQLEDAKLQLKKSKRKDYYKILGVTSGAADDELKKAYKKEALKHHPDRHASASPEEKEKEEKLFKEVNEAYSVLSDKRKRARYDTGQDLEDAFMASEFDPNSIFQAFFGGGPGGGFNFASSGAQGFGGPNFQFHFG